MDVRASVLTEIAEVAAEQNKPLSPLTDQLALFDSGLDSLCLAIIVARLEEKLGLDPFNSDSDFEFPLTVGDLVALYEGATV